MRKKISYADMASKIKQAEAHTSNTKFVAGILKAMDAPAATIKRAGLTSDAVLEHGVPYGKSLLIQKVPDNTNIYKKAEDVQQSAKRNCRIVFTFNDDKVYAKDTEDGSELSCDRSDLHKHAEFFFPVIGRERNSMSDNQKLDATIGDKITGLITELTRNHPESASSAHQFILSFVLLLILDAYYGLTKNGKTLSGYLETHSDPDGNDMAELLQHTFHAANGTEPSSEIKTFDSRLFPQAFFPIIFSKKARRILLELSGLRWSDVASNVPGLVLQSLTVENLSSLTDNYLSQKNVLRLIDPLFIEKIHGKINSVKDAKSYEAFMDELDNIYILNPDSSSGDCIIGCINELNTAIDAAAATSHCIPRPFPFDHFLGIEPDSTAVAISRISLCLCALSWSKRFGALISPKEAIDVFCTPQIINARSFSIDWNRTWSPAGKVYILGNTQYVGARHRDSVQNAEFNRIFANIPKCGDWDYCSLYVYVAAKYLMQHDAEAAFIVTNSLTQGRQASEFWKHVFDLGACIRFGRQSFKLRNEGRQQTAVTVVIVGIAKNSDDGEKTLYVHNEAAPIHPQSISPYLVPGDKIITERTRPIGCGFPKMVKGNMPYDGGHLILSAEEKAALLSETPEAAKFLRFCKGSKECLNGIERYCLYITRDDVEEAMSIPKIKERIDQVRLLRLGKKDPSARKLALRPWSFREENQTTTQSIIVPAISSENYVYLPMDIIGPDTIATNLAFVIYNADEWMLGVLMSRMHNIWIRTVCGGLETRVRYSNRLGYNTFPFPEIPEAKKEDIRHCVADIYIARENMIGTTLAQKYKPAKMTTELKAAHQRLDFVIDGCYQKKPFLNEEDRLYHLFNLYEDTVSRLDE